MLATVAEDPINEKRFLREAESMKQLSHPNIISIYDIGKEGNHNYFTMQFVDGKPFSEYIDRISSKKVARVFAKIAKAIHYAHGQNIIHRDLKPSNIMIGSDGEPIVMDFGLARQIRDGSKLSQTGAILGTPAYMAPEQAKGTTRLDQKVDVYALGVCLYQMLTGQLPFTGNQMQVLLKVFQEKPIPPREIKPTIPQALEDICLKAMEKEKQLRFPSALSMARELEKFVGGKTSPRSTLAMLLRG